VRELKKVVMNENKGDQNAMNEAWEKVGSAVNQATDLYLKELEAYLDWVRNVRKDVLEQTLATGRQLSRMGEAQYAFLAQMQQNLPLFGWIPRWTNSSSTSSGAAEKRPGRAT
jgi:hypothetical protein